MAQSEPTPTAELPATQARQGRLGRPVVWVLVISVVLAAIALTAAWLFRAPQLAASDANNGTRPTLAHSFNAPPSQPIQSAAPPN